MNKELLEALEETSEALEFALGRLGCCGNGDGKDHKADADDYGGMALLGKNIELIKKYGILLKQRLTPAQENTHSVPPSDSKTENVYGVVGEPKNAVRPVFHIGDKIRFKSTGTIEKVHYITGGGRFINSVSSTDVELVKE